LSFSPGVFEFSEEKTQKQAYVISKFMNLQNPEGDDLFVREKRKLSAETPSQALLVR
jgi:hypothetical protein